MRAAGTPGTLLRAVAEKMTFTYIESYTKPLASIASPVPCGAFAYMCHNLEPNEMVGRKNGRQVAPSVATVAARAPSTAPEPDEQGMPLDVSALLDAMEASDAVENDFDDEVEQ